MKIRNLRLALFVTLVLGAACTDAASDGKVLVASRGASAYAPEHTRASYELAIDQGADYIELDLQVTSDGVLIVLRDPYLDRTTDAEFLFPERFRLVQEGPTVAPHWFPVDFTLDQIKELDAGSWYSAEFSGERVLTLAEAIEIAEGRVGLVVETSQPEFYREEGFDMEELLARELEVHGLNVVGGVAGTPVLLQSASLESLGRLRNDMRLDLPSMYLLGGYTAARRWFRPEGLDQIAEVATGISALKEDVIIFESVIQEAHARGMTLIPYTFGSRDAEDFESVVVEARYFLEDLGVDGLFMDNPDLFPR